eukprot:gene6669-4778_t
MFQERTELLLLNLSDDVQIEEQSSKVLIRPLNSISGPKTDGALFPGRGRDF